MDELFRTWPDGVQETIGREMLGRLMHNPTLEGKGVGRDQSAEIFEVLRSGRPYDHARFVAALRAQPRPPWEADRPPNE